MTVRLSISQLYRLRALAAAGEDGLKAGNTEPTFSALERKGYCKGDAKYYCTWRITDKGREFLGLQNKS